MLESMRAATQGLLGRGVMTIVLGLIILSFVIWGVGDIFRGYGQNKLAEVGKEEVTTESFRLAYQNELQRLQRQAKRPVTNEEARRFGLDRQVLSRLVSEAVLNEETAALRLAISDEDVARMIAEDPAFKGANGQFDRTRFIELLRDNGLNEKTYVRDQRGVYLRQELIDAMTHGLALPEAMLEAIHRYQAEARTAEFFVVAAPPIDQIALPSQEELRKYYDGRKSVYAAPELRSLVTLALTPETLAKPELVSDADARRRYDEIKDARFGSPEKRQVDQLFFVDAADAKAARDRLDAGASFEDVVAQAGRKMDDVSLGLVERGQIVDPAAAEVAFSLPEGAVSAPVKTGFGTVLLRVASISPSTAKPFAEVEQEVRRDLAIERARPEIARLHDAIEDQRASGRPLAEAAKAAGLEAHALEPLDATGKDKAGVEVPGLVNGPALLKAAFASDVGVDNETLSLPDGGYQWFEVAKVEKARERSFDEARAEVEKDWRTQERERLTSTRAADLVKKIEGGESIAKVAADGGYELQRADGVTRGGGGGFPQQAAAQLFNVPVGGAGAAGVNADDRLVFRAVGSSVPPMDPKSPMLAAISDQVKRSYLDDLVAEYLAAAQTRLGVRVNPQAFAAATGAQNY